MEVTPPPPPHRSCPPKGPCPGSAVPSLGVPGFHFLPCPLPIFIFERNLATFSPLSTFATESQEAPSLSGLILAGFYESAEQPESHPALSTWQACVERGSLGSGGPGFKGTQHKDG